MFTWDIVHCTDCRSFQKQIVHFLWVSTGYHQITVRASSSSRMESLTMYGLADSYLRYWTRIVSNSTASWPWFARASGVPNICETSAMICWAQERKKDEHTEQPHNATLPGRWTRTHCWSWDTPKWCFDWHCQWPERWSTQLWDTANSLKVAIVLVHIKRTHRDKSEHNPQSNIFQGHWVVSCDEQVYGLNQGLEQKC